MNFQLTTYRWDDSLMGGAELHHRRLAKELMDKGHQVRVLTTNGGNIQNSFHWGVSWETLTSRSPSQFPITRKPILPCPKPILGALAKIVQRRYEWEVRQIKSTEVAGFFDSRLLPAGVWLAQGWHYPEFRDGNPMRWSHPRATIAVSPSNDQPYVLRLTGYNPVERELRIFGSIGIPANTPSKLAKDGFDIRIQMNQPAFDFIQIEVAPWRPMKEFRSLGVFIDSISIEQDGREIHRADLSADLTDHARSNPGEWQRFLLRRCEQRPWPYQTLIDLLRGPVTFPGAMRQCPPGHVNIVCNMPWSTMSQIREGDLAMPLWHVDDEFYYWKHWIAGLRRARFVLANTPYTAEKFFPNLGIRAHFVGPPLSIPERNVTTDEIRTFRAKHGIADNNVLFLTVCRKSGEKRYEAVAKAVANLARAGKSVKMIGVGPDADKRPFDYANCQWLGALDEGELQIAYAACDVFSLMSESESFGMVIPESWHQGKPVVVNRRCGPSASLVAEGIDGLLAVPGAELEECFARLADDAELRARMGEAGRQKALRDHVRGAAADRLLKAMAAEGMLV
ncbi:glycosyltransferase family 4 protein [Candidatus Sumerlaeota bacterium]|nr:glycosyltransferase family 4 protein [Candidatus Sumerlaeota bacterium]